jgi:hypothetical protein
VLTGHSLSAITSPSVMSGLSSATARTAVSIGTSMLTRKRLVFKKSSQAPIFLLDSDSVLRRYLESKFAIYPVGVSVRDVTRYIGLGNTFCEAKSLDSWAILSTGSDQIWSLWQPSQPY